MRDEAIGIVLVDGRSLTLGKVALVARANVRVRIDSASIRSMKRSRSYVEKLLAEKKVVYGLTTGFGKFSDKIISAEEANQLQLNLIRSHACGIGDALPIETVRAIMLLRINGLALGYSGIRPQVVQLLSDMLNRGVTPVIPEKGSLGASGDLAPLSHLSLVLVGEGEARVNNGDIMPGGHALASAGLTPVTLEAKEGLALINGTQVMSGIGALACWDAVNLADWADCAAALTFEVLLGVRDALEPETHLIRPHPGQIRSAENIKNLTAGSRLTTNQGEIRVQDAYTLRCAPQVHGATRDALSYISEKLTIEFNSATDNPLVFAKEDRVISGGNFHGQPIAIPMDLLTICASELANISERRIERLVNPQLNESLPAFLTANGGLQSGFMIAQYTAAAIVSENKALAHPASVDSIPSSGNQEDHVSMGTIAARKAKQVVDNAYYVLAIELLCAAQAADFRGPDRLGKGTRWLYEQIRSQISFLANDRELSQDIRSMAAWMQQTDISVFMSAIVPFE